MTNRLILTGEVVDAMPSIGALDILASASDAEGVRNLVIEAASAGICTAATAVVGTVEII